MLVMGQFGTTSVNRYGYLEYISEPWFVGTDTFTYTTTDSFGSQSTGEVHVTIKMVVCFLSDMMMCLVLVYLI